MNASRVIAESWLGAFQARDTSRLNLAEDFVHSSPFGEVRGRENYLDLVRGNEEAFFKNEITVIDFVDGSDRFAVRYVVGEMSACDVIYVRDGKIDKVYSYYHVGDKPEM